MYQKIPFETIKSAIASIFSGETHEKWELIPDHIQALAKNAGIELEWNKIKGWHEFEYGNSEISNATFIQLLLGPRAVSDQQLILITDECFQEKMAYQISIGQLEEFINSTYPDIHGLEFFQPQDFFFFVPQERFLALIHHEGFVVQLNL